ncbi:MAG: transposase [Acidobacteria bacterium]|nr:transposase [Acidobacteriota bacterium]
MFEEFDDNRFPLAYLITFRCYGTWLHGDERRSVNREQNIYGTPRLSPSPPLKGIESSELKTPPLTLDAAMRTVVEMSIRDVCTHRPYLLRAINVRSNHVHAVVSAASKPEAVMEAFKAYATRALRAAGLLSAQTRPWARHGSTRYLWKPLQVERAIEYVINGQGEELPAFLDEND